MFLLLILRSECRRQEESGSQLVYPSLPVSSSSVNGRENSKANIPPVSDVSKRIKFFESAEIKYDFDLFIQQPRRVAF